MSCEIDFSRRAVRSGNRFIPDDGPTRKSCPGTNFQRRGSEVGSEDITIDLPEARLNSCIFADNTRIGEF